MWNQVFSKASAGRCSHPEKHLGRKMVRGRADSGSLLAIGPRELLCVWKVGEISLLSD